MALGIAERLSKQDPSNTEWQRLLSICHGEIGIVLAAQGDEPGALAEYRKGLGITEWLAAQDPANTKWQRDLSVSHLKIGNVLAGQDNKPGAVAEYDKSLKITQALAEQDPANADWQRDLVDLEKLSEVTGDRAYAAKALNVALDMQKRGLLAPTDVWMIEELRRRVGQ